MFAPIETSNPAIVAFDARGRLTDEDYGKTLIPALERAIADHGRVRALIRFGPEFEGYTAAALIDDAVFGLKHMRDFERIAVVTDIGWIRDGVGLLAHLSPIPLKLFPADATEAALAWLDDADA